jgi:uncharacterized phosphosugar-binding protein
MKSSPQNGVTTKGLSLAHLEKEDDAQVISAVTHIRSSTTISIHSTGRWDIDTTSVSVKKW